MQMSIAIVYQDLTLGKKGGEGVPPPSPPLFVPTLVIHLVVDG